MELNIDPNFKVNRKSLFNDYIISWDGEYEHEKFKAFLDKQIPYFKSIKTPSLWVFLEGLNLKHLHEILPLGFIIHKACENNKLALNLWLNEERYTLPEPPFSTIGLGGLCIKNGKVLSVRENYHNELGKWKIPGGLLDKTKDCSFFECAKREVFEETGVKCTPKNLLFFMHRDNVGLYSSYDIYGVVLCDVEDGDETINYDTYEIGECKWLTIEEFLSAGNWLNNLCIDYYNKKAFLREYKHNNVNIVSA